MTTEAWTILRLLEWTESYFRDRGFESPRLEAEVLLAEARDCQRIELYTAFNDVADEQVRAAFRELVRRRGDGAPVAYLVGHREFFSRKFRVTEDVLIPRPETEFAILELKDLAGESGGHGADCSIVDVGTGSGIIAVTAALELPSSRITAIDISSAALAIAQANAESHGVADRIHFEEGNLLGGIPPEPVYDYVVSNPPYVSEPEYEQLDKTVRDFEPKLALVGGPTGTEIIAKLIPQAAERLKPGGRLILEISPMIEAAVHSLITDDGRFHPPTTRKDLSQLARIVTAQKA